MRIAGALDSIICRFKLAVGNEGVEGQIDLYIPRVAVSHSLPKLLIGEVGGVSPCVERLAAEVYGVRTAADCGDKGVISARRGKYLGCHYLDDFEASSFARRSHSRLDISASVLALAASSR